MQELLSGKTALVTGGASGIGKAACLAFAREGAAVCVVDRNAALAAETVAHIVRTGGRATAITADVANEDSVRAMVAQAIEAYGRLDCCFNNAGIGTTETHSRGKRLDELELADWQRMQDVNLTGVFLCMKYELRHLVAQGGAIVNTASIAGLTALPKATAYVAAKHGVVGLTKSAAIDYAADGVRINAICPGHVTTPLLGPDSGKGRPELGQRIPLGRLGTAEEIAEMVVWLCSDRAAFTTGAALLADGGRLAGG